MSIYKIKRFAKTIDLKDRVADASVASIFGAGLGIIPGALVGSILGGTKGARVGAAIGAGLGALSAGKLSWNLTSKNHADKLNKELEKKRKDDEKYIQNPKIFLNPILNKKDSDYKDQGLPKEFFKLLQVNRQFIPLAEKLIKEKKVLWRPEFIVVGIDSMKMWRNMFKKGGSWVFKDVNTDEDGVTIMINPDHADDTFINWYPENNSYSFDFNSPNDFKTLKEALTEALSLAIEFSDDEYLLRYGEDNPKLEIDKIYLEYLQRNL
jgi:hypothetical protein